MLNASKNDALRQLAIFKAGQHLPKLPAIHSPIASHTAPRARAAQ